MKSLLFGTLLVALISPLPAVAGAAAPAGEVSAIIAKARAYYGPDAALDGIRSIHMVGSLSTIFDVDDATAKPVESAVDIVFQKPYRQKVTAVSAIGTEITALDGFDAWHRVEDRSTPPKWNMTLQSSDDIKRLRANANENLSFYKGLDLSKVENMGTVTMNGVICHKIAMRYDTSNIFYRYIDQVTGKLVMTETAQGSSIKEEGEMMVDGVRFPRKSTTTIKQSNGKTATITVTFTKVTLNETFPDSYFAIPSILPPK